MANRTVVDTAGRTWTCGAEAGSEAAMGRDVVLSCVTESVAEPVKITVSWQWEKMAPSGLARMLTQASPVSRH